VSPYNQASNKNLNSKLKNNKILLGIILFSLIFIIFFFTLIFLDYKKSKSINHPNENIITFLLNNLNTIIKLDFKNKRIKSLKTKNYIKLIDKNFSDDGFILFSGFNSKFGSSITSLFSLQKNKIIHSWIPPIEEINLLTPDFVKDYNLKKNYRMQHPLLNSEGELIFSSGEGPLVKIDKCSNLIWAINRHFHHSIEFYKNNLIISPIVLNKSLNKKYPVLNHGFAIVDLITGNIIKEFSAFEILEKNGFQGLLFGVGEFEYDRIHLNDVEVIRQTDNYVEEGDLILSSKHLSSVFLYRPNTNKIIWLKTGPWLNQHDIDYLGNGLFSIFGNDTFRYNRMNTHDVFYKNNNNIYLMDIKSNKVTKIFENFMKDIKTPTQGLHQILKNGDLFIEETDTFKIHRFGNKIKRWEFVNFLTPNEIGSLHWSRYLPYNTELNWLNEKNCE